MVVRLTMLVLVGAVQTTGVALGQGFHGHGSSNPWVVPDARSAAPFGVGAGPGSMPPGMYDPTMVVPAGATMPPPSQPGMLPPAAHAWHPGHVTAASPDCPDGDCDETPWEKGWQMDGYLQTILRGRLKGAYFRADYLLYDVEEPGNELLGENSSIIADPRQPFTVFDIQTPSNFIGVATVPDTGEIFLRDVPGARLTFGTPVRAGTIEISGFILEQATDDRDFGLPLPPDIDGNQQFLATTTLLNGELSNNVQLYDQSLTLAYTAEVWGAGARFIMDGSEYQHCALRPTIGWNYFAVQESMVQRGTFVQTSLLTPGVSGTQFSVLRAETYNNVFGIELGFQAEAEWWIFKVGVEPAVTLGPNAHKARTTTDQFAAVTDPNRIDNDYGFGFSPVFEFGVYGTARVKENLELRVGYDLIYFTRIQRPADSVVYDIDGTNNTSLVRAEEDLNDFMVNGLNVSIIYHFPR